MGLPEIIIEFKTKGVTAIKRSARGIVAIVLKDDTEEGQALNIYKSVLDVDPTHFTARNYEYLKLVYEGSPAKTIVLKVATTEENLNPQLKQLNDLKWNYLVIPGITDDEKTTVAAWIKEARDDHHKTFKAVLPNCKGDHEGIINLTTDNITSTLGTAAFSTAEYCCRIAGVLAGLSLARSCSYFELTDITAADVPEDANERIDNGELVIVFDGEKYKIGRGVNSLTSFTPEHGQDFSKIKIIEGVDLYQDDIRETFESSYVGKVINDYDNKQALVAAILAYHRELEGNVLDRTFDNTAAIDVEAQETYLQSQGTDTSEMDETALAQANTGSKVFITSNVKFVDAMEGRSMSKLRGNRTLAGTWGEIWVDGELIAELSKIEVKVSANREDVQLDIDVDSKMTGIKGEFTLTIKKAYTRYNKVLESWKKGVDLRSQIITKLADPDATNGQQERYSIDNCWYNDLPLVNYEKGGLIEEEATGGFTPSDMVNLDAISA